MNASLELFVTMRCFNWLFQVSVAVFTVALESHALCERFAQNACAEWTQKNEKLDSEPLWNVYTATENRIFHLLRRIIANGSMAHLRNEAYLYNACVEDESDHLDVLQNVVEEHGGVQDGFERNPHYNYLLHIAQVTVSLNIHPILSLRVLHGRRLHITRGDLIFPEMFLSQPQRYSVELKLYRNWIEKCLRAVSLDNTNVLFKESESRTYKSSFGMLAKEIVEFESELSQLPKGSIVHGKPDAKLVRVLMQFPNMEFTEMLMDGTYYAALNKLVSTTHWRVIANYISWSIIKELSRDVNRQFREWSFLIDRELLGVKSDVSRDKECIQQVVKHLGHRQLLRHFMLLTNQDKEEIVADITEMTSNILHVFVDRVQANVWLSDAAKQAICEKIESTTFEILEPSSYAIDESILEDLHGNYLINMIRLRHLAFLSNMRMSTEPLNSVQWPGSIFDVNAYYSPPQNAIILPLGILQAPFYHQHNSAMQNYGALGSLIGHELSHILDNLKPGVNFSRQDFQSIARERQCIQSIFESFGVDEEVTLFENVADFIGIRLSFAAMQMQFAENLDKQRNKMFFESYAKIWCEIRDKTNVKQLLLYDEHAPVSIRVDGTLLSFEAFRKTFQCAHERMDSTSTQDCESYI